MKRLSAPNNEPNKTRFMAEAIGDFLETCFHNEDSIKAYEFFIQDSERQNDEFELCVKVYKETSPDSFEVASDAYCGMVKNAANVTSYCRVLAEHAYFIYQIKQNNMLCLREIPRMAYELYKVECESIVTKQMKIDKVFSYYLDTQWDYREYNHLARYICENPYNDYKIMDYAEFIKTDFRNATKMFALLGNHTGIFEEYKKYILNDEIEKKYKNLIG